MSLSGKLYKRILLKLDLSKDQLLSLKAKLASSGVCVGPFVKDGKMCPVTNAVSLKTRSGLFTDGKEVSTNLTQLGIRKIDLFLFYLIFDIPAMISNKFFENKLKEFQQVIEQLIQTSSALQ